ncbi:MAG: hypothetical protein ACRC9E_17420, partial [Plesiomonas shigelloides]
MSSNICRRRHPLAHRADGHNKKTPPTGGVFVFSLRAKDLFLRAGERLLDFRFGCVHAFPAFHFH